ncbi:MAG: hypothetical protein GEV08_17605, partial [Acidimicrobiia bacterium]|nr:hypothetical protein [Acidimicrobiia bacterium]
EAAAAPAALTAAQATDATAAATDAAPGDASPLDADLAAAPEAAPAVAAGNASTAPAPASGDAAAAEVAAPPPPWSQVADLVRSARRAVDGSHQLSVRLEPDQLGRVQVDFTVRDGRLSMVLTADSAAAREQLQRSLPELRASLASDGVQIASLEVGSQAADSHGAAPHPEDHSAQAARRLAGPGTAGGSEGPAAHLSGPAPTTPGAGRLDIRL